MTSIIDIRILNLFEELIYMLGLFDMVFDYCCFGRAFKKEQKLINRIKEDILILTQEELDHLKKYLFSSDKYSYCF